MMISSNFSDPRLLHQYHKLFQASAYPVKYNNIGTKVCTNIHGSQSMNPMEFSYPLTFPVAPP